MADHEPAAGTLALYLGDTAQDHKATDRPGMSPKHAGSSLCAPLMSRFQDRLLSLPGCGGLFWTSYRFCRSGLNGYLEYFYGVLDGHERECLMSHRQASLCV